MKMPIKLNKSGWPGLLTSWLPTADDPRNLRQPQITSDAFTQAVSVFKFGTTFKTTQKARFPQTVNLLGQLAFEHPPVVLDVGASDGITSLHVMQNVPFKTYYLTDLNPAVWHTTADGRTTFYTPDGQPILIVSDRLVVYSDFADSHPLLRRWANQMFESSSEFKPNFKKIDLINPAVLDYSPNIVVQQHSIFDRWPGESADLVIAANILNRSYFSDSQLVQATENLLAVLNQNGVLAIIDSRNIEKSTLFRKTATGLTVLNQINGGTEIHQLLLDALI